MTSLLTNHTLVPATPSRSLKYNGLGKVCQHSFVYNLTELLLPLLQHKLLIKVRRLVGCVDVGNLLSVYRHAALLHRPARLGTGSRQSGSHQKLQNIDLSIPEVRLGNLLSRHVGRGSGENSAREASRAPFASSSPCTSLVSS